MSEDIPVNNAKKIFSFNLKRNTIERLDLLRSEPVTRSELIDALLEYLLTSPDFISNMVNIIKQETQYKVKEALIIG